MNIIQFQSHASTDPCSFSHLPDDIVFNIISKFTNLKTLSICKLVSRRFYQIVLQVDNICFPYQQQQASRLRFPKKLFRSVVDFGVALKLCRKRYSPTYDHPASVFQCKYFLFAIKSMKRFTYLKSLCIELPSSCKGVDKGSLFKWKIKFGNKFDSLVFLSPDSICDMNGLLYNVPEELKSHNKIYHFALNCFWEATERIKMLRSCIVDFPLLEKVSITDLDKRGTISLSGAKINEMRNTEAVDQWLNQIYKVNMRNIPLLELPVSGYVMKGVTLVLYEMKESLDINQSIMTGDTDADFEGKDKAAYNEAVMEILNKHW